MTWVPSPCYAYTYACGPDTAWGLVFAVVRWLNNEQALADSANFMANVKFEGISEDLTAPGTPWIYYGVCLVCVYGIGSRA